MTRNKLNLSYSSFGWRGDSGVRNYKCLKKMKNLAWIRDDSINWWFAQQWIATVEWQMTKVHVTGSEIDLTWTIDLDLSWRVLTWTQMTRLSRMTNQVTTWPWGQWPGETNLFQFWGNRAWPLDENAEKQLKNGARQQKLTKISNHNQLCKKKCMKKNQFPLRGSGSSGRWDAVAQMVEHGEVAAASPPGRRCLLRILSHCKAKDKVASGLHHWTMAPPVPTGGFYQTLMLCLFYMSSSPPSSLAPRETTTTERRRGTEGDPH